MNEFKISCSHCGQRIACDDSYIGASINCPSCGKLLTVAVPPSAVKTAVSPAIGAPNIFISYRLGTGDTIARRVRDSLNARGYTTCLREGAASPVRLNDIAEAKDFVLVCTRGCLDACADEADQLRAEICHALSTQKNIVLFATRRFQMPAAATLPGDIAGLTKCETVVLPRTDASGAGKRLPGIPSKYPPRAIISGIGFFIALLWGCTGFFQISVSPDFYARYPLMRTPNLVGNILCLIGYLGLLSCVLAGQWQKPSGVNLIRNICVAILLIYVVWGYKVWTAFHASRYFITLHPDVQTTFIIGTCFISAPGIMPALIGLIAARKSG